VQVLIDLRIHYIWLNLNKNTHEKFYASPIGFIGANERLFNGKKIVSQRIQRTMACEFKIEKSTT